MAGGSGYGGGSSGGYGGDKSLWPRLRLSGLRSEAMVKATVVKATAVKATAVQATAVKATFPVRKQHGKPRLRLARNGLRELRRLVAKATAA
jgi:hypothetical protein